MRWHISAKRSALAAGATVLLAGLVAVTFASSGAAGDESGSGRPWHTAFQPIGTWAWTTDLGAIGSLPVLISFHSDGTVNGSDGFMFANPLAPPAGQGTKRGPLRGVWKRTGHHTFGATSLWFQYNPAGVVTGYSRSRSALELVDADHFQGVVFIESLGGCNMDPALPPIGCPDPTDPAAVWTPSPIMPPGGFPVSATRIHRIPPPEEDR